MKFDKEPWEPMSIDMTPMVDAIFAIILFLLVAATFVKQMEQDLSIELPTYSKELKVKVAKSKPLFVNVKNLPGDRPVYSMENRELSRSQMLEKLSIAATRDPEQSVVVCADKHSRWQHVADVIGSCAEAGITKVMTRVDTTRAGG